MSGFTGRRCGNCGSEMRFLRRENLLGMDHSRIMVNGLPNLFADRLEAEIWGCPGCRKLEFYACELPEEIPYHPEPPKYENGIAQTTCPYCGTRHDLDDPRCPRCRAANPNI